MTCKGWCRNEKSMSRWTYVKGLHSCTICEKSMKPSERCYCCGHVMRKGAQENKARQRRVAMVARI